MSRLAGAVVLTLLFALAAMDGTRAQGAYALTDREIFLSLRSLHGEADGIRRSGPGWRSRPPLEDIGAMVGVLEARVFEIRAQLEEW